MMDREFAMDMEKIFHFEHAGKLGDLDVSPLLRGGDGRVSPFRSNALSHGERDNLLKLLDARTPAGAGHGL